MNKLVLTAAIAAATFVTMPAWSQQGAVAVSSAPGKVTAADTIKVSATITALDAKTRDITLKGPEGKEVVLTAGPDMKNFDKLKVGDKVDAQYVEALTLQLVKGGGKKVERTTEAAAVGAKKGAEPGGAVGREVKIVADVIAVDTAKQMVTLKGPQRTVELKVKDPEQLKLIAKGDQIEATYVQALAIAVEPAAKK